MTLVVATLPHLLSYHLFVVLRALFPTLWYMKKIKKKSTSAFSHSLYNPLILSDTSNLSFTKYDSPQDPLSVKNSKNVGKRPYLEVLPPPPFSQHSGTAENSPTVFCLSCRGTEINFAGPRRCGSGTGGRNPIEELVIDPLTNRHSPRRPVPTERYGERVTSLSDSIVMLISKLDSTGRDHPTR